LSSLTTNPKGVLNKTEEICDGGVGVSEKIKETRYNFTNITSKYMKNPPNSKTEIDNLKTRQHSLDNKEIPF